MVWWFRRAWLWSVEYDRLRTGRGLDGWKSSSSDTPSWEFAASDVRLALWWWIISLWMPFWRDAKYTHDVHRCSCCLCDAHKRHSRGGREYSPVGVRRTLDSLDEERAEAFQARVF